MIVENKLPEVIKKHILKNVKLSEIDHYEKEWKFKYRVYRDLIIKNSMEIVKNIDMNDKRKLLLFSYSGSIIYLGPKKRKGRSLQYCRLDSRTDTPNYYSEDGINFLTNITLDRTLYFDAKYFKNSSPIFEIAVTREFL